MERLVSALYCVYALVFYITENSLVRHIHLLVSWYVHNSPVIRTKYTSNQSEKRTTVKNTSFVQSETRTIVLHSAEGNKRAAFCNNKTEERVLRFALLEGKIDDFIDEQEDKNTKAKTDRDVSLLKLLLQRKVELRNVEEIPPAQLNELLSEFVFTVRSKDGKMTTRPHHGREKDSVLWPAVLMKFKGELFHTNHFKRTAIFRFFNEIFALAVFKTEVVQFSSTMPFSL